MKKKMEIKTLNDLLIDTQKRRDSAKDAYDESMQGRHKDKYWAKFSAFSYMERHLSRLLNSENEVGVSDSIAEHGGLPHVRKSECEAKEIDTSIGESEQITLGNRIDSEKKTCGYFENDWCNCANTEVICKKHQFDLSLLKES